MDRSQNSFFSWDAALLKVSFSSRALIQALLLVILQFAVLNVRGAGHGVWGELRAGSFSLNPDPASPEPEVQSPAAHAEGFLPARIIIKFKPDIPLSGKSANRPMDAIARALSPYKIKSSGRAFPAHKPPATKRHPTGEAYADLSRIYAIELHDGSDVSAAIGALLSTGLLEYAEAHHLPALLTATIDTYTAVYLPNDSLLAEQYYLSNVRAHEAWAVSRGDTSMFVAIVDTGNDFEHPDLINAVMYNYEDPVDGEDNDQDGYVDNFYGWDLGEGHNFPQYNKHGHGVHVSGISSATADNRKGIAGSGFHARYLPVKIDDEFGRLVKAYEGIVYAADRGAPVINCSWGGHFGGGQYGEDIVRYATINRDALVVAGSGNASSSQPFYPASYEYVLGVAATDSLDQKWELSSYGPFVDLTAPGVRLMSTWPGNMYIRSSGSSMSAPLVAGAAAIIRSHFPELTAMQTAARLKATADNIDTIAANREYAGLLGAGRLNMYRALTEPFQPWMRIFNHYQEEVTYGSSRPGNTLALSMTFQNLLASAQQITATLSSSSKYVEIVDSTAHLGAIPTFSLADNLSTPFMIRLRDDTPISHTATFFVDFCENDTLAAGRQAFVRVVNSDYLNIDAGRIQTTVTAKGAIGFNYPELSQGVGMLVDRGYTQLKCAGLVYGNAENRVIDNIYGTQEGRFSQFMQAVNNILLLPQPQHADIETLGLFNDEAAADTSLGIRTTHHGYFWKKEPNNNFFISEYRLVNTTEAPIEQLYAGFFADWTSRDSKDMMARFLPGERMAYANIDGEERFAGLQLLSVGDPFHYAFDHDGLNGSIRIKDGFSAGEKFMALSGQRDEAGSYRSENDVASMLSSGRHYLAPGDTLSLAWALHTASSLEDLSAQAQMALQAYRLIRPDAALAEQKLQTINDAVLEAFPNPFSDFIAVRIHPIKNESTTLYLFNKLGVPVIKKHTAPGDPVPLLWQLPASHLPAGPYVLVLSQASATHVLKLLKYE